MWFKIDDHLHDHKKVRLLLELYEGDAVTALGLWTLGGSWSGGEGSDGLVSGFVLNRWRPDWQVYATMLVEVGLWHNVDVNGRPHVQYHDYTEACTCRDEAQPRSAWNPSKKQREADTFYEQRRNELSKDFALIAEIRTRDGERCRYCGSGVDFHNRRGASGGTYDHVDPDGPNNLTNVVVACRGCNGAKGHRTPEQWGFGLLRPGSKGPVRRLQIVPSDSESTPESGPSEEAGAAAAGRVGPGSGIGSGRVGGKSRAKSGVNSVEAS